MKARSRSMFHKHFSIRYRILYVSLIFGISLCMIFHSQVPLHAAENLPKTVDVVNVEEGCPDVVELNYGGGTHGFGLRYDGVNMGAGQSLFLPCTSKIDHVEVLFNNYGYPMMGVPPLVTGDPLYLDIMSLGGTVYATAYAEMAFDSGEDWISFDFSSGSPELPAGTYLIGAYTTVPRYATVVFCPSNVYSAGQMYRSSNGGDGPWEINPGVDMPFKVWLQTQPPVTLVSINLSAPPDVSMQSSPPTFAWTPYGGTNNAFALDFFIPGVIFWSTYDNLHEIIYDTQWTMPGWMWDRVPPGRQIFWQVRGVDLDVTPRTIITSDEVWSFYKQ